MFHPVRPAIVIGVLALAGAIAFGGVALATPSSGTAVITTGPRGTTDHAVHVANRGFTLNTRSEAVVTAQTIVADPGWSSGWHTHPGPTIVIVVRGTLTRYHGDCTATRVSAGDAFVEGDPHPGLVRNEGTEQVELRVTYVTPTTTLRIDEPNPGCAVQ